MTMKKFSLWALFTALMMAFVACSETDINSEAQPLYTIRATVDDITRTTLGEAIDGGYKTSWVAGDMIGIYGSGVTNKMFTTSQSGTSVDFTGTTSLTASDYVAYYPYMSSTQYNEGVLSLELPTEQLYSGADYLLEYAPMAAYSTDGKNFSFKNLCGLVRLQLFGSATIEKITFESLDGDLVSGTMAATISESGVTTTMSEGVSTVALTGLSATLSSRRLTSFYIALPEGDYTGIKFVIQDSEKNIMTLQASNFTLSVRRSVMSSISAVTYQANGRIYEVGDLYNNGSVKGIVYEVDATGQHGKIVSLDEYFGFYGYATSNYLDKCTSYTDGLYNKTQLWNSGASYNYNYPMPQRSSPWYIPALNELRALARVAPQLNTAMVTNGGVQFTLTGDWDSAYSSSTLVSSPTSWTQMMGAVLFEKPDTNAIYAVANQQIRCRTITTF
jgi:hypothetical protein